MSEVAIFIVGAFIFAITVYGSVMAGGLALTRAEQNALPADTDAGPVGADPMNPVAIAPPPEPAPNADEPNPS